MSPYDNIIDVNTAEGSKLYFKIVKGLEDSITFSSEKDDLAQWLEHIRPVLVKFRLLPALDVVIGRPTATTVELVNYFDDLGRVTSDQLVAYVNNLWVSLPVLPLLPLPLRNPDGLGGAAAVRRARDNAHRELMMSKSCMLGELIFNSIVTKYQPDIILEAAIYQRTAPNGNVYDDGTAMLGIIFSKVDPSTVVGVSNLKELIERADLASFNHDVPAMLMFFKQTKAKKLRRLATGLIKNTLACCLTPS